MALFGLSPSPTVNDPILGTLTRSRGFWRGRVMLGDADLPLLIAGGNEAPDVMALALARELPVRYLALQDLIGPALFEHYEPYADTSDDGDFAEQPPRIPDAAGVWPQVTPLQVTIAPLAGRLSIEIAYTTRWDVEHTLGAIIADWRLIDLNGSILLRR